MKFEIAAGKILGTRKVQEDSWRLRGLDGKELTAEAERPGGVLVDHGALVVIADGMGGHGGGDVASRLACERFAGSYFTGPERSAGERLDQALKTANTAIADAKVKDGLLKQMGCTLVAAHLASDKMTFVSVGDSLLIRVRGNEVHRVNEDHSNHLALDLRALESDSEDAWKIALNDQQRYSITSAVTGKPLTIREIDTRRMESGDILIFATDGLETLDYQQIRAIVVKRRDKGVAAVRDWLLKATEKISAGGRQDNTTVIVVRSVSGADAALAADSDVTQIRSVAPSASGLEAEVTEIRPAAAQARPVAPAQPGGGAGSGGGAAAARLASQAVAQPHPPQAAVPGAPVRSGSNKVLLIAGLAVAGVLLAAAGLVVLSRQSPQSNTVQPQAPAQPTRITPPTQTSPNQVPAPSTPPQSTPVPPAPQPVAPPNTRTNTNNAPPAPPPKQAVTIPPAPPPPRTAQPSSPETTTPSRPVTTPASTNVLETWRL